MSDIHDAIFDGDIPRVKMILNTGSDIEQLDDDGDTPFLTCCTYRPILELIHLLIDHGANINAQNVKGETALSIAAEKKMGHVADILLAHNADVNIVSDDGATPLFWAVYKNQVALAKELLHRGADPNVKSTNPESGTTLLWAAGTGDMELVRMLVNQGAEINAPGVLHLAIPHIPVLEYLISEGADINKKGHWGTTALHMAAYKCKEEAVRLLVANGADISITDDNGGQTPYEWAKDGGCECENIKKLLGGL